MLKQIACGLLMAFAPSVFANRLRAEDKPATLNGLPLVLHEDFEQGRNRWETTDETSWTFREVDGNHVFGINRRNSNYKPKVRSPLHIALLKDVQVADFVLTFRVQHQGYRQPPRLLRVFNHQDAQNFYYVHLGAKPDPASGQIMLVKDAPRTPLTKNERPTPWTDQWHTVKVERSCESGKITVYFDDMQTPHMEVTDTTFGKGRIGIGSFDDMNDFDDLTLYGK